ILRTAASRSGMINQRQSTYSRREPVQTNRATSDRQQVITLTADEFIRRFLLHVLPKGFHRIRHYGLLAGATRKAHLERARRLLGVAPPAAPDTPPEPDDVRPPCPCCGGHMVVIETFERQCQPRAPPDRALLSGMQAS
ncbi:transposase, partial [Sphingomonas sp.]|uniref:transposase n=1 Tax=Sphingomonas sp. TaxID=28214 RepID=UPI0031DFAA36